MGWARTLLLGDIGNRLDIEDTERAIANLRREIAGGFQKDMTQDEMIRKLFAENAELKLLLTALMRVFIQKGSITKDELERVIEAVDAEDGSVDGQFNGNPI
jgi:hypothetical protein